MSTPKGYPSNQNLDRVVPHFSTVEPVLSGVSALSTLAHIFVYAVGTDTAETGSAVDSIKATAHAARRGDVVRFTSGNLSGYEFKVTSVSANYIVPAENLSEAPANGDGFQILRHKYPVVSSTGSLNVVATLSGANIQYTRNSADQVVTEDTGTPANNRPLPVKLLDSSGNENRVSATQSGTWNVTNISGTVSLPTGASTEATLSTASSTLTTISGKLPATLGQKAMTASLAVVLASDQSAIPVSQSGTWNVGTLTTVTTVSTLTSITNDVNVKLKDGSANAITSVASGSNRAIHTSDAGRSVVTTVRNDYSSTSVTTGAWVQLVAATSSEIHAFEIFDSSGQTLELGTGAAASETRLCLIFPGGNHVVPVRIAASTRVSVRAVSATASVGELDINFYGG